MVTMASSTASDGFAVFNGIQYLLNANVDFQDAAIELNDTLDLSNYPSVTLEFEQMYRAFNYDKTFVELSTDYGSVGRPLSSTMKLLPMIQLFKN